MRSVTKLSKHIPLWVTLQKFMNSYQGCSEQSGWSGFGQTTISQGKNKVPFCKKQVIKKSTRVIFGLVQLVILQAIIKKIKNLKKK